MSPNLLVVDRNKQAGASPCDRATLPISLLYHYYTTNTTTIPQISLLYHSIIIPQFFCAGRLWFMLPRCERTACDCSAIARWRPHYLFSLASSPSAMAHAQNARAAPRALASSDIASRRRTTRSLLCGNRGPTYVHANSAASPRVRTVTSRARRRGGSNTKSVTPRKLARHNRSSGTNLHNVRHSQFAPGSAGRERPRSDRARSAEPATPLRLPGPFKRRLSGSRAASFRSSA